MEDYILRATINNGSVRALIATTKNLVNTAYNIHNTSPVATAALGRLLTASAMMGAMLKNDNDLLTLSIKGDGPLDKIVTTANNKSIVKGYVINPKADTENIAPGKLNVGAAVGDGTLTVVKDMGLKEPQAGQINLVSGEIAEDLTYYFAKSEQTPSSVALGVLINTDYSVQQAGGFIIQIMPEAGDQIITHLEQKLASLPTMTSMLNDGKTPEDILNNLFDGYDIIIHEKLTTAYGCNCSKEKSGKVLISLGETELTSILKEDRQANIHCHFCNKDYTFLEPELKALLNKLKHRGNNAKL